MPTWTTGLLDDDTVASGRALPLVVRDLQAVRRSGGGEAVGCVVVSERELPTLAAPDLPVHLAVTGGAGSLEAGLRWVAEQGADRLDLVRVSVRLRGEAELAHNARRVVTVLDSVRLDGDVEVHAVPPAPEGRAPSAAWLAALDVLAEREVGLRVPLGREQTLVVDAADPVAALGLVRSALDGEAPPPDWLTADPGLAERTRRWCRAVVVPDLAAAVAALG